MNEKSPIHIIAVPETQDLDVMRDLFTDPLLSVALWSMQGLIKEHIPELNEFSWRWRGHRLSNGGCFIAPSVIPSPGQPADQLVTVVNSDARFVAGHVQLELAGIYLTLTLLNELSSGLYQSEAEETSRFLSDRHRQLLEYAQQHPQWSSFRSEFWEEQGGPTPS